MSIDYNDLRTRLNTSTSPSAHPLDRVGANVVLEAQATDLAHDVLRLHDGIEAIRDDCADLAESARAINMHIFAREMDTIVEALADLLEGDGEPAE